MDAAKWAWSHTPTYHTRACMCISSAARSNFVGFLRVKCSSVATKLHACVKSTIPARYSFRRIVAERLRQQWHDLASSPGSRDEARLSQSFNWMQNSLLAPTTQLLIAVLHKQELGITTLLHWYKLLNAQKMCCLLEIKAVVAKKEMNQVLSKAFWYD